MRLVTAFTVALALGSASARAQAPYLVKDIWPGVGMGVPFGFFAPVGDRVAFGGNSPESGREVWISGGTEASTTFLDVTPGTAFTPTVFGSAGTRALFITIPGPLLDRVELWSTDGTVAGSERFADTNLMEILATSRDRVLLSVQPSTNSRALVTDGTAAGTQFVPPPVGATLGSIPFSFFPLAAAYGDGFALAMGFRGAWFTQGAPPTTNRLESDFAFCSSAAAAGGRLFLVCSSPPSGLTSLRVSDGTYAGTTVLQSGRDVVSAGDQVFFFSSGALSHSDGTPAGTGPVPLPTPAPTDILLNPFGSKASGNVLFFSARTAEAGRELWRTDGTAAGTFMLRDIEPGTGSGLEDNPQRGWIGAIPGGVVFSARTSAGGKEVWISDGTTAGTVPLAEIVPGPDSSDPSGFTLAGGRVYFTAYDAAHGFELWAIDVPNGSVSVDDVFVEEGDSGPVTATFTVRLESESDVPVVVSYESVGVTALSGIDYGPRSGTLTFAPGEREKAVPVLVFGDVFDDTNESAKLVLTPLGGAVVTDGSGTLVILDDDQPRVRAAAGPVIVEGNSGSVDTTLGVTLETDGGPSTVPVSVYLVPSAGTASTDDFSQMTTNLLTFPAGSPSGSTQTMTIAIRGDVLDEPNETFSYEVDGMNAATVVGGPASGLILDDDGVTAAPPVELAHGATVRGDLAPPAGRTQDRDYFVFVQQPRASYEVVVDEASGDAAPLSVQRTASGAAVLQSAVPTGTGTGLSLRWISSGTQVVSNQQVRIQSASCGSTCGTDDTYRVRFYETTLRAPRVNNANGQTTVVLLQNRADATVSGRVYVWTADGTLADEEPFTIPANGAATIDTAALFTGTGSLTVAHDAPYGALAGKVVSLEPATGLSFDTPLQSIAK